MITARRLKSATSGRPVLLKSQINAGGEGAIWRLDGHRKCAKIYHDSGPEFAGGIQEKIARMIAAPPEDPTAAQGHTSIAWPEEMLLDGRDLAAGFVMPYASGGYPLNYAYHPRLRAQTLPGFTWYALHVTALNCAWIMKALHEVGYAIGDVRPENFLVTSRALVTVIDTDSFQIPRGDGTVFACSATTPGFTAPELFNLQQRGVPRGPAQDIYGLAVLIYVLLMGVHPFHGCWEGEGESPTLEVLMQRGMAHFMAGSPLRPGASVPPFEALHPALQACFEGTLAGTLPEERPSISDWIHALEAATQSLAPCRFNPNHYYSQHARGCVWCLWGSEKGHDLFPSRQGSSAEKVWGDACVDAAGRGDFVRARHLLKHYPVIRDYPPLWAYLKALEEA